MKKIFFALSLLAVAATASAAEFADTSVPDQMIDIGVRFGISSSNLPTFHTLARNAISLGNAVSLPAW